MKNLDQISDSLDSYSEVSRIQKWMLLIAFIVVLILFFVIYYILSWLRPLSIIFTMAKYHTYGWYLSLPQISQIYTDTLVASNGLIHINSHSKADL